jgi:hypothetical protein
LKRYPKDPIAEALLSEKLIDMQDEVDLVEVLELGKEVLRREIKNLSKLSLEGKLKPAHSESLGSYVRLLSNLVKEEKDKLKKLSKEELEQLQNDSK